MEASAARRQEPCRHASPSGGKLSQNRRESAKRPEQSARGVWRYVVDVFKEGLATEERLTGTARDEICGRQGLVVMETALPLA